MIKKLDKTTVEKVERPVKILQFGEGNFLRAFVDWQIDIANEKGVMNAGIAICKPRPASGYGIGVIESLQQQDCLFHTYLEGVENREVKRDVRLVKSVMDAFNPYTDYAKYEHYCLSPELEIIVSNTTEAPICHQTVPSLYRYLFRS